ncbi:MAG: tetratricopeptide repeat protein [Alphaproteobacteria bacterium]
MSADVAGNSRLMGADEAGTLATLKALRRDVFAPQVAAHKGRVVKLMGDGALVEFPSIVNAVDCAVAVQRAMADHTIKLRIGINLGDVIVEGSDIYGDGVNVAARIQEAAKPGGVALSGAAHDQIVGKVEAGFADGGAQDFKNIAKPVHLWHWSGDKPTSSAAPLALPDKPSIAVLPFDNMSGDPEQEYFADGITEDIITALSRFRWFFVIARNSTFVYKGRAVDVKTVGRELGVRYVLEGSVRKAANRIRVTAQLIEAETGNHVWAERYDRSLEDFFELQDEITSTIAAAVEPELAGSERQRSLRKPTAHLDAWDLFQRGVALLWRQDRTSINAGCTLMRQAVGIDPGFGQAYGYLAFGAFHFLVYEWANDRDEALQQGVADAGKAIAIDQRDYFAHHALGRLSTLAGDHAAAVRALETCLSMNPNFAMGYGGLAEAHVYSGDPKKAVAYADTAMRLSPNSPSMWDMLHYKASAYVRLDDFDRAIEIFENTCEYPAAQYVAHATLAALYVIQGREAEGRRALQNALRLEPTLSIAVMKNVYGASADRPGSRSQRLLDALRTAGLAEA